MGSERVATYTQEGRGMKDSWKVQALMCDAASRPADCEAIIGTRLIAVGTKVHPDRKAWEGIRLLPWQPLSIEYAAEFVQAVRLMEAAPDMVAALTQINALLIRGLDDFSHDADCLVDEDDEGCTCNRRVWEAMRLAARECAAIVARLVVGQS